MATLTCHSSYLSTALPKPTSKSSLSLLSNIPSPKHLSNFPFPLSFSTNTEWIHRASVLFQCSNFDLASAALSETDTETENEEGEGDEMESFAAPPVKRNRRRYRKQYPGEKKGITEEMRFVTMKLRNSKGKPITERDDKIKENDGYGSVYSEEEDNKGGEETWEPSIQGFLKYLVDSRLVFSTIERIVDESSDVFYVYFRKTGLERAECISNDLEWFSQQGHVIPEPSNPGVTYATYLEELAEKAPPLFLSHFYNIYFSHIAGGQVIAKKALEQLVEEKELESYMWKEDAQELLRGVRENLNMLAKHWSRDNKNKCLREVTKAFRFLGQIVRLIIL